MYTFWTVGPFPHGGQKFPTVSLNKKGSKSRYCRCSVQRSAVVSKQTLGPFEDTFENAQWRQVKHQCSGVKTNIGTGTKESTLISPTHAFCPSSYSSFFWKSTKIDASFPRPSWITITCRYCGRRRQGRGGFRGTGRDGENEERSS